MDLTRYVLLPLIVCAELVFKIALECEKNLGVLEVMLQASAPSSLLVVLKMLSDAVT